MEKTYQNILDKIPQTIDFGFITVKNETFRIITLENPSNQNILFNIESQDVYNIEPKQGVLNKKQKLEIKVAIFPNSATVLVANAKITLDNNEKISKIIKFSSVAKYPYLRISRNLHNFEAVLIGKWKESEIIVSNSEKVPAKFKIVRQTVYEGKQVEQFFLSHYKGEVPPNESFRIVIRYQTHYTNYFSYETFKLKTIGGNSTSFSCIGNSLALSTSINAKSVNYNSIELTKTFKNMIRLFNDSEEPTTYQFFHVNDGNFFIEETQGVIEAKSNVRVNVTFFPKETMIYYDRVFCLIKNHTLSVLDIYGSCHGLLNKTKILEQKNIDIFRHKLKSGLYLASTCNSVKELDVTSYLESVGRLNRRQSIKEKLDGLEEGFSEVSSQVQLHKEMFWENISNTRLFYFNAEMIDFRFVEYGKVSEPFVLTVYNNSTVDIRLKWILERPIHTSNMTKNNNLWSDPKINFLVTPEEAILNYRGSAEFKVYFRPGKQEFYYFSRLTCIGTLMTDYQR